MCSLRCLCLCLFSCLCLCLWPWNFSSFPQYPVLNTVSCAANRISDEISCCKNMSLFVPLTFFTSLSCSCYTKETAVLETFTNDLSTPNTHHSYSWNFLCIQYTFVHSVYKLYFVFKCFLLTPLWGWDLMFCWSCISFCICCWYL